MRRQTMLLVGVTAALLMLVSGVAWAAQATFAPAQNYGAGSTPVSVTTADFNGDAKADLAVANGDSDNVTVLLGNGGGTFLAAQNFAAGNGPSSVIAADLDGDNDPDLAVANANNHDSDNVSVRLNSTGENDPPVANSDFYRVNKGKALNVPAPGVLGDDQDPDGDPLTARLVSGPTNGRLTTPLKPDGSFTYKPKNNFTGTDRFTYEASDDHGGTDTATVTIRVR